MRKAIDITGLNPNLASPRKIHHQALAGQQRRLEISHTANLVIQRRFPRKNVTRIDGEIPLNLFFNNGAESSKNEIAGTRAIEDEGT